jgi:hypothetical protein
MCGWICGGKTKPCEGGDSWCGRKPLRKKEEARRRIVLLLPCERCEFCFAF